jgi:hypothetical protein
MTWLCRDAFPSRRQFEANTIRRRGSTASSRYHGVFTDDPATIGARLPRPRAPFVPAPESALFAAAIGTDFHANRVFIPTDSGLNDPTALFDFTREASIDRPLGFSVF